MEQRICAMCKEKKDILNFKYRAKSKRYNYYCLECQKKYSREYQRKYRAFKIAGIVIPPKTYAIYKGDEFLYMGTAEECAKKFNVKRKTVYYWNTKAYKKRIANRPKAKVAEVVED